jgi:hypothetical protein
MDDIDDSLSHASHASHVSQMSEHDALVQWLDSSECSYSGIRDRLLLGHHAMRVAAGLPTFASFTAAAVKGKADTASKAKLREAQKALEDVYAELQATLSQREAERVVAREAIEKLEADRREAHEQLNQERLSHGEALVVERDRLSEERARMASQQADILTRLADVAEARGRLEAREAESRARAEAREAEARARAEAREADAHSRLESKLAGIHSEEVRKLRTELDRLKGTNHVKGIEGETSVSSAIRGVHPFDSWTFVDTSGSAGSSDFHMVSPTGETLVVEVKNKITVTAGDVSKSQRDVAELKDRLGDAFLGYLFVSLRCRSIPGKGALNLEVPTSQSVPILWCGLEETEAEDTTRDVVRATRLLVEFGRVLATSRRSIAAYSSAAAAHHDASSDSVEQREREERRKKTESDLEEAIAKLNSQLQQLDEMRKIAARLSESASVTRRHAASMQSAIDAAFMTLDAYRVALGASSSSSSPTTTAESVSAAAAAFECSICGKVCTSKNGLSNHARSCKNLLSGEAPPPQQKLHQNL